MTEDVREGDRIELVHTDDPYTKLQPGSLGVVTRVSRHPSRALIVHVRWDEGSNLMLLGGVDQFRVLPRPDLKVVR